SDASVGFGSTSAPPRTPIRILPTTTFWHRFGFRRIKGTGHALNRTDQRFASALLVRTLAHPQDRTASPHGLAHHPEVSRCAGAGSCTAAAREQARSIQSHHYRMAGKGCHRERRGDPTSVTAARLQRRSHDLACLPPPNPPK